MATKLLEVVVVADYQRVPRRRTEPVVLPYFGGTRVDAADRRFRMSSGDLAPGWWRFADRGPARGSAMEPAAPG